MPVQLPRSIMDTPRNLAPVTAAMAGMGFRPVASEVGTMDSGSARYSDDLTEVIVWKDRSQWFIGDERAVLKPLGSFGRSTTSRCSEKPLPGM
jgi:hypothetical protein